MAKVTDFLPEDTETAAVQGYVPKQLRSDVIDQMAADKKAGIKIGWNELLEASLKAYLSERKGTKRVSKTKTN